MNRQILNSLAVSWAVLIVSCSRSVPDEPVPPVVDGPADNGPADNGPVDNGPAVAVLADNRQAAGAEKGPSGGENGGEPARERMQQVLGTWNLDKDGEITSPEDQLAVLQLSLTPPAEYIVSLRAKRLTADRALVIGLPAGGRQVLLVLDQVAVFSGLELLDGKYVHDNEAVYRNGVFATDQEARVVCTVHKDGITCTFNGKTIVNWRGDLKRLSLPPGYNVPDPNALFLATRGSRYAVRDVAVFPYAPADLLSGTPTAPEATMDGSAPGSQPGIAQTGFTLPAISPVPQIVEKVAAEFQRFPHRPLPTGSELRTHIDFEKQRLEFRRSRLVLAYDKSGNHDARWDDSARALLERAAKLQPDPLPELIAAGDEVIGRGCDDPLVCFVHAWHLWRQQETARAEPLAVHAILAFEKSSYAKRVTRLAPLLLAQIYRKQSPEKRALGYRLLVRGIRETVDAACEPFASGEQRAFLADFDDELGNSTFILLASQSEGLAHTISGRSEVDPWLAHILLAEYQFDQAWKARGDGYAGSVTDEGWKIFREGVEQARAHFLEAWQLHREFPEAAVGLIRATMAAGGVASETTRFWFDEAVAAQFDAPHARDQLLLDLLPRWHGSHEQLLKFGLECLDTKRFDTEVPRTFQAAVDFIEAEDGNLRELLHDQNADDALERFLAGYEQQAAAEVAALKRLKTQNLVLCWRRGWRAEAKRRLADLGDQLDAGALQDGNVTAVRLREDLFSPVSFAELPKFRVAEKDVELAAPILSAGLSPDGTMLVVASGERGVPLQVVELSGGKSQTLALDPVCLAPRLQFSPDGKFLAAQQYFRAHPGELVRRHHWGTVTIWKLGEPAGRDLFPRESAVVEAVCWLPDQRYLAAGFFDSAVILDVETGRQVATTADKASRCIMLAASPDGKLLATGHVGGEVGLWEVPPADQLVPSDLPAPMVKLFSLKQHGDSVIDLEFSPDGKRLASSSDKDQTVWLWSTETRTAVKRLDGRRIVFSPNNRLLVTCGGPTAERRMAAWNALTGAPEAGFAGGELEQFFDAFFSPDGSKLMGIAATGVVRTWDPHFVPEQKN
jgi:hypothetical protein